jgi:hypothetical protein
MRLYLSVILSLLFMTSLKAEIWEKPTYQPDENHLPSEEWMEKQEEREREHKKEKIKRLEKKAENFSEKKKPQRKR